MEMRWRLWRYRASRLAPLVSGRGSFWGRGRFLYRLNVNVLLMGRWTVVVFGERRILPTVYLVC